jgi:hypothetical protein
MQATMATRTTALDNLSISKSPPADEKIYPGFATF